jgi:predicted metal-dependent hydrolase
LQTGSGSLAVHVLRSARRTFQLSVTPEGQVICKAPLSVSQNRLESLLRGRTDWIERTRERILRRASEIRHPGFVDGAVFFVLGRSQVLRAQNLPIEWPRFLETADGWSGSVPLAYDSDKTSAFLGRSLELWFRRKAEEYFALRLSAQAIRMELAVPAMAIKEHRRLWGSCNKARLTVNLNWRIISFFPEAVDYVLIHELCHLRFADHSRKFWSEVVRWCPEWRKSRAWIRREAHKYVFPPLAPLGTDREDA